MNQTALYLDRKTLFVTGATGFLGQPLVEKILHTAPGVERIYVLIRPKRQSHGVILDAQRRLERELYDSSVFDRLRAVHGDNFLPFLREKLIAVSGDISEEGLGIDPEVAERLRATVDVVINSAAVVSFDAPLDDALHLNVEGARRVAEFSTSCPRAILVHVSTAYVSGATHPIATETIYHTAPAGTTETFPRGMFSDLEADFARIREIIDQCKTEAQRPEVEREFTRVLLERSRSARNGRSAGRRKVVESLRRKWLENRLRDEGMRWARQRGWNDTYTYTKALGEQVVLRVRGSAPTAVLRPSVIESSLSEPIPGWLDGLRMADPLIAAIGKGRLRALPMRPDVHLDLVPVDMVVNALLAAIPRVATQGGLHCYQVATGSRNPITLGDLYDLIYRYFIRNPMLDRSGKPIRIRYLRFPRKPLFKLQHKLRRWPLDRAERMLERMPVVPGASRAKRRISATRTAFDRLYYYGEIYEPYLNMDCRFEVDNTMALFHSLDEDEKRAFHFDVTQLNWRHYVQNVHIPGIKRYILKMEGHDSMRSIDAATDPFPTTIPELLGASAARFGNKTALQIRRGGEWQRVSFVELAQAAATVAENLRALRLERGDRVVLFSENQPEWGMAYLGAVSLGLTVVPLDAQTWHKEVWAIAHFTGAKALLVSENCFKRLAPEGVLENDRAPEPIQIVDVSRHCAPWRMHEYPRSTQGRAVVREAVAEVVGVVGPSGPGASGNGGNGLGGSGNGANGSPAEPAEIATATVAVQPDDPASIIFTSGTASDPKGAVHTHRGFLANLQRVLHLSPKLGPEDHMLSVLPLYHALEFTCGFLGPVHLGATVTYASSLKPKNLVDTMRETGTTYMLGVPTLHALLRDEIERRVLKDPRLAAKAEAAGAGARAERGSLARRLRGRALQELRLRVREEVGGRLRFVVSGGSALGPELYEDFYALGIPIYEGYGLTETAPVLTLNPAGKTRAGSVGKPLPGVELRLSHPDRDGIGEIVVRTPSLMRNYDGNPTATAKAIRDGWFHTGDLGWIDEDGYVFITGRIKDVIVTGAGKNVYPSDLEAIYSNVPGVSEICVVGVKSGLTEEVHAVVVPNAAAATMSPDGDLRKAIQREMQILARDLPSYHRLQYVHLWNGPLPRNADGEVLRDQVLAWLRGDLERRPQRMAAAAAPIPALESSQEDALLQELARLSGIAATDIRPESDLYSDLGLDSLEAIELLLFLETQFGVAIPDAQADAIRTVGDLQREVVVLSKLPAGSVGAPRENLPSLLPARQKSPFDRALLRLSLSSLDALYHSYFQLELPELNGFFPLDGPYIIAANHSSHLDVGAIMAAIARQRGKHEAERLHVLGARDYFFDKKLKSWFFSRFFNVVPIRRDQTGLDGLRTAKSILSNGEPVLIFPEATRSRTGKMQAFKPGLGLLAFETNVPVIPAHIRGTFDALPAGRSFPKSAAVRVRFGDPIPMDQFRGEGAGHDKDDLYRRIAHEVRVHIERLAGESSR
jgi:long-chain acyl-CoA synthetase